MLILGLLGVGFIGVSVLMSRFHVHFSGVDWNFCPILRLSEFVLYLAEKVIFVWFCFRSRYRAEQEAADIVVFDIHIRRLWYLMPVPMLLLLQFYLETRSCFMVSNAFMDPALIFGLQSFIELALTKTYLRWHQNDLKTQEGYL